MKTVTGKTPGLLRRLRPSGSAAHRQEEQYDRC
jgi:hypothetical protein